MSTRTRIRGTVALIATAATVAGCGGSDPLASCDTLPDEAIAILQGAVEVTEGMTMADLATDEPPAAFEPLEARGVALAEAGERLGCDEDAFNAAVNARIDEVDVEPGSIGAIIVEGLRNSGFELD